MIIERIESRRDQLPLELAIIEPEGKPVGIVQFVHGMAEHKERYYDFMNYLATNGYICAIHDHRGHGASVRESGHLGYFYTEDTSVIVDDVFQVTEYLQDKYGALNISIFSHSMGTLVARNYLKKYGDGISRIVLCGPPTKNGLVNVALILAKVTGLFHDKFAPNKFLGRLSLGPYNKEHTTQNSWLCSDSGVVDAYNADPLCGFTFTTNGFTNLYKLLKSAFNSKDWKSPKKDLPVLLIAGDNDPVIQSKQKFIDLEKFLRTVGYENITSKLYGHKRHELLNEIGREDIYKDVLRFFSAE